LKDISIQVLNITSQTFSIGWRTCLFKIILIDANSWYVDLLTNLLQIILIIDTLYLFKSVFKISQFLYYRISLGRKSWLVLFGWVLIIIVIDNIYILSETLSIAIVMLSICLVFYHQCLPLRGIQIIIFLSIFRIPLTSWSQCDCVYFSCAL